MHVRKLIKRNRLLEGELKNIKAKDNPTFFGKLNQFLNAHQFLFSVLVALLTIIYIQIVYDINPLESYKNISTTKKFTEVYQEMGDRLLFKGKYEEAKKAYKSALEMQPNNSKAIIGLAKAQIFIPIEGQKYTDPEAIDMKLDFLIEKFPLDSDLYYLKGANAEGRFDLNTQKEWLEHSIALNDKNENAYVQLGYACYKNSELDCAYENFKKALDLEPDSHLNNLNFGYCELMRLRFTEAIKYLEKANNINSDAETSITLGEAYKLSGDFSEADDAYQSALGFLNENVSDEESTISGNWLFSYMPLTENDDFVKITITFDSREDKKILVHFLMSVNYALSEDFISADKEFKKAIDLNKTNGKNKQTNYNNFFISDCLSVTKNLMPNKKIKTWLQRNSLKICSGKESCKTTAELLQGF